MFIYIVWPYIAPSEMSDVLFFFSSSKSIILVYFISLGILFDYCTLDIKNHIELYLLEKVHNLQTVLLTISTLHKQYQLLKHIWYLNRAFQNKPITSTLFKNFNYFNIIVSTKDQLWWTISNIGLVVDCSSFMNRQKVIHI